MFWLRKLVLCRMEDNDVEKHIERMNTIFERLNSLIAFENPLTADNIYATALLISLPVEWLASVMHLLNQPHTTSVQIVTALNNESNRRLSLMDSLEPSVATAQTFTHNA